MSLKQKKIIVTGGARGIGEATARAFGAEGADVAILDVLDEEGTRVAAEIAAAGAGTARYYRCDIADRASVNDVFAAVVAALGGLDVMANIAGVERHTAAEDITEEEWDFIHGINVKGTLFTNQAAFSHMKARGGRILNFGSDAALMPYPKGAHYSASKAAVIAWTRTIAHEWGRHGITVNSIVPALWTPMYDDHRASLSADELAGHDAMMQGLIPLGGKLGDPARDFAPVMLFLAGEGARFITGQIISVNGGLNSVR